MLDKRSPNTCAPTLNSLSGNFGLQSLIGKQAAFVSDMRLGHRTDHAALAENLLRISGEDTVDVDRKYKTAWIGQLSVRFFIMTNVPPRFVDVSGVLASRFVPLIMRESFIGRENPRLLSELLPELPGILNWSIAGWRRLHDRSVRMGPGKRGVHHRERQPRLARSRPPAGNSKPQIIDIEL